MTLFQILHKKHALWSCFTFLCLSGCGANTVIDDGEYRPVGARAPQNTQVLSETTTTSSDQSTVHTNTLANPKKSSELDVHELFNREGKPDPILDERNNVVNDSNNIGVDNINTQPHTQKRNQDFAHNEDPFLHQNSASATHTTPALATTNKNVHTDHSRYGETHTVNKILRTLSIHCTPQSVEIDQQTLLACSHTFSSLCGGHTLTKLSDSKRDILVFHANDQYNVLDTIVGSNVSQAGLWDTDDHVSIIAQNVAGLFSDTPAKSDPYGMITYANTELKTELGLAYEKAIHQISQCF